MMNVWHKSYDNKLLIMTAGVAGINSIFSLFQLEYKKENLKKCLRIQPMKTGHLKHELFP